MKIRLLLILGILAILSSFLFSEDALFYVSNAQGDTIFAVYPSGIKVKNADGKNVFWASNDSVRFYLNDDDRGSRGGFAIGGTGSVRNSGNTYFNLSPDSIRFYIKENDTRGSRGGFAIGGTGSVRDNGETYFNLERSTTPEIINPSNARMLWYPTKEAFRVGKVIISSSDSVGTNSIATGFESKAIGDWSQAFGYKARAKGNYSTAIGKEASAEGTDAFALGYQAQALGNGSYAFGSVPRDSLGNPVTGVSAAKAEGDHSFAFGLGTVSSGIGALATGVRTSSSAYAATAMGYRSEASGTTSFSVGNRNYATGSSSASIGSNNHSDGRFSFTAAVGNIASNYASIGIGDYNNVSGERAVGLGTGNTVAGYGSVAIGENNNTTVDRSFAFGLGNTATHYGAVALGENTTSSGRGSLSGGQNTTASGNYSFTVGRNTTASGDYSVAMGSSSQSTALYSVSMGSSNQANGDYSIAMGYSCEADTTYSVAIGNGSHASGENSVALGYYNNASGRMTFVAGGSNTVSGTYSSALGYNNNVSDAWSLAAGSNNTTDGQLNFALGDDINLSQNYSVGIGEDIDISGVQTFGFGRHINASYSGCMLFGDFSFSGSPLSPTMDNQFAVRASGGLRFYTTNNYDPLNMVTIKSYTGDLGIGTNSPRHKLNVVDDEDETDGSDGAFIDIENLNNASGVASAIRFKNGTSSDAFKSAIFFKDTGSYGRGSLMFAVNNNANNYDVKYTDSKLTIEQDGSVCVHTNSSAYDFYVNGNAGGSGAWHNTSDVRLKKDIHTIKNPLQKVMKLRGVNFKWKDESKGKKTQMGFIAQEAEKVIPEVVDKSDKYYTMQYAPVTALLVEAVKELKKENDDLKKRLEKLEKEMAARKKIIK